MDKSTQLENAAIDAAIKLNWPEAIKLNEEIIKSDKKNVDAYLRLGFAYLQQGKVKAAKKFYKKALGLQPGNYTIISNLDRIKVLETKKMKKSTDVNLNPYLFLDIPSKTKSVVLVNSGQKAILAKLTIGQELQLFPKKRRIEVRTNDKEYVGCLPDDISKRMTIFIKAGSVFKCYVKESTLKEITVFLKEEKKGRKVTKYASFPVNVQANLSNITLSTNKDDSEFGEDEEISEVDLDKLAESLSEEKEFLDYGGEDKDEEAEE